MSFVKHGDGKIVNILDEKDLTEEQKKSVNKVSEKIVKQSKEEENELTDTFIKTKKSGS